MGSNVVQAQTLETAPPVVQVAGSKRIAAMVFGQAAMLFYIEHRLVLEAPATYFGLRGGGSITTTYIVLGVLLVGLYAPCWWFRTAKAAHPNSTLKYF